MPRPTKYAPEVVERICEAIRMGATYELAAGYGGVHYDTLRTWTRTKPAFFEALKAAEAEAAVGWLSKIEAASDESWQAAAWKLERRYPQNYGRTVIDQKHSGKIEHEHVQLEQAQKVLRVVGGTERSA